MREPHEKSSLGTGRKPELHQCDKCGRGEDRNDAQGLADDRGKWSLSRSIVKAARDGAAAAAAVSSLSAFAGGPVVAGGAGVVGMVAFAFTMAREIAKRSPLSLKLRGILGRKK